MKEEEGVKLEGGRDEEEEDEMLDGDEGREEEEGDRFGGEKREDLRGMGFLLFIDFLKWISRSKIMVMVEVRSI